jgi:hypothetical protein
MPTVKNYFYNFIGIIAIGIIQGGKIKNYTINRVIVTENIELTYDKLLK